MDQGLVSRTGGGDGKPSALHLSCGCVSVPLATRSGWYRQASLTRQPLGLSVDVEVPRLSEAFPCLLPLNLRRLEGPPWMCGRALGAPFLCPHVPVVAPAVRLTALSDGSPWTVTGQGLQRGTGGDGNRSCMGVHPVDLQVMMGPHPRPVRGGLNLLWS